MSFEPSSSKSVVKVPRVVPAKPVNSKVIEVLHNQRPYTPISKEQNVVPVKRLRDDQYGVASSSGTVAFHNTVTLNSRSTTNFNEGSISKLLVENVRPASVSITSDASYPQIQKVNIYGSRNQSANVQSGYGSKSITVSSPSDSSKFHYTSASKQLLESIGGKRKTCSCTKSLCLKLYCECFANGEFCFSCNCTNCFNTLENDFERNEAVRAILSRNPNAFHPKVGKAHFSEEKSHYRGCNCRKTNCVKNYCECFEARILCTSQCKCVDCFNCEERSGLRCIGDVTALRNLKEGTLRDLAYYKNEFMDKLPFTLMTQEVIEASVQCLLAQAEEAIVSQRSLEDTERLILQEFGRCTSQIIENAAPFKTS